MLNNIFLMVGFIRYNSLNTIIISLVNKIQHGGV